MSAAQWISKQCSLPKHYQLNSLAWIWPWCANISSSAGTIYKLNLDAKNTMIQNNHLNGWQWSVYKENPTSLKTCQQILQSQRRCRSKQLHILTWQNLLKCHLFHHHPKSYTTYLSPQKNLMHLFFLPSKYICLVLNWGHFLCLPCPTICTLSSFLVTLQKRYKPESVMWLSKSPMIFLTPRH